MSSTQHQLIKQCATRLRGIVEALDNIHDTSPHRWSTDLDDVHSSAESLLAMINDQASNQADLAQPSPVRSSLLINGYQLRAALEFIAPDGTAKQLESEARIEWRQQDADFLEAGLYAWCAEYPEEGCVLLDEEPATAQPSPAQAEQAEAERPEVEEVSEFEREDIARSAFETAMADGISLDSFLSLSNTLAARYERIVGALRAELQAAEDRADTLEHRMMGMMTRHFAEAWRNRDTQKALDGYLSAGIAQLEQERDAAQARVAELEMLLRKLSANGLMQFSTADEEKAVRAALSGAQAQHSVPEGVRELLEMLVASDLRKIRYAGAWRREVHDRASSILALLAAAPGKEVPQAWLDVQAERSRQVEAECWTPEHDDAHSHGQMARAAACYALAGSSAPNDGTAALLVSLAWPWDEQWWKPTTTRRDLVKACALALAEIERLDRAAASQGEPSDA
ncbi:hypothetical protein [Pseudomonas aeruginosa]|uniref:hypothetical protein n=1 Tax=Pseudomonas aeruginosa TaxID=287 RepID=UPI0021AD6842|nr:hypothetical protein [Pseudomonas aeruginosa]